MRNRRFMTASTVASLAGTCLVLATGAAAGSVPRPDDRATHGAGAVAAEQLAALARPDDRTTHGTGAIAAVQATVAQPGTTSSTFDWADAGVGALAMLGLTLLVAGGSVVLLRRRPEPV